MANYEAMQDSVYAVLRDTERVFVLVTEVKEWLNEAYLNIVSRLGLLTKSVAGTTASDGTVTLPADFLRSTSFSVLGTDGRYVETEFTSDDIFISYRNAADTTLETILSRVFAEKIETFPARASVSYKLEYVYRPVPLRDSDASRNKTVNGATATASVAEFTTSAVHGYAIGEYVKITGVTPAGYNGTWKILTLPTTSKFTAWIGTTPGSLSVNGTSAIVDQPVIPEELHIKLVNYARANAKWKEGEVSEAETYWTLYIDGLPPESDTMEKVKPGPFNFLPVMSYWDGEEDD